MAERQKPRGGRRRARVRDTMGEELPIIETATELGRKDRKRRPQADRAKIDLATDRLRKRVATRGR